MRKIKEVIVPIMILSLFIILMTSGGWIKQPFSEKDDVMRFVELIQVDIDVSDWNMAMTHMNQLNRAWQIVLSRLQFVSEQDRIYALESDLAILTGAIKAHDQESAIIGIETLRNNWDHVEN